MQIFDIIILILSFFVALFFVYALGKEDFMFVRKNITLERVFNIAFMSGLGALLTARVFFVLFHVSKNYANPLVFLAFVYFPGLSLLGGILGTLGSVFLLTRLEKNQAVLLRLLDMFSLSVFGAIVYVFYPYRILLLLLKRIFISPTLLVFILSVGLFYLLIRAFLKDRFKDGSTTLLFLVCFSLISLLLENFIDIRKPLSFLMGEGILYLIVLCVSIVVLIRREKIPLKSFFKKLLKNPKL